MVALRHYYAFPHLLEQHGIASAVKKKEKGEKMASFIFFLECIYGHSRLQRC